MVSDKQSKILNNFLLLQGSLLFYVLCFFFTKTDYFISSSHKASWPLLSLLKL